MDRVLCLTWKGQARRVLPRCTSRFNVAPTSFPLPRRVGTLKFVQNPCRAAGTCNFLPRAPKLSQCVISIYDVLTRARARFYVHTYIKRVISRRDGILDSKKDHPVSSFQPMVSYNLKMFESGSSLSSFISYQGPKPVCVLFIRRRWFFVWPIGSCLLL